MENLELAVRAVKEAFPGMKLLEQEPMSAHSSFRIGGPARVIAYPQDVTSFSRLCSILKEHHIAPFILGNGTNILFPDEGLQDLFLKAFRICSSSVPRTCRRSSFCRTAPSTPRRACRWQGFRCSRRKTA